MEPKSDIRKAMLFLPTEEHFFTAEIMQRFTDENIAVAFQDLTSARFVSHRHQTTHHNKFFQISIKQLNSFFHTHSECKSSAVIIPILFECSDQQNNG